MGTWGWLFTAWLALSAAIFAWALLLRRRYQ